ncbi:hypothetical protein A3H40_01140 [Candidatus Daviesbacteria bacterium RIFCSPLOWO2_02_FULL_38_15]|uniref:Uncharacterized protein n=1 Tax=Candidatus Daviesbacteria bacterium RIFCSPLOWO2_02_FULL_38_15 TaxID=1797794 RepID=A0A1F5N514_9BACT|nr:MAG: hypothetical protein A3H40_01140 [Candidatus Daviesbacteria bacterium RIFCSPLOWO2_02_FULL_38_15]
MPIQINSKQSDLEKRLKILRQQVYGKNSENSEKLRQPDNSESPILRYSDTPSSSGKVQSDTAFLYHDLRKIFALSVLAIGTQIILFIIYFERR